MSSTGKCPFCGSTVLSDQRKCPDCGADNPHYTEDLPRRITRPTTIDELKEYCAERGMPLLRMRFFIGEDYREPKAFGIYRDGSDFVVYKNKADGTRAVRYRGPSESHAVGELFAKLLEECHNRGIYPDGKPAGAAPRSSSYAGRPRSSYSYGNSGATEKKRRNPVPLIAALLIMGIMWMIHTALDLKTDSPRKGYYRYSQSTYYYSGRMDSDYSYTWFTYGENGWKRTKEAKKHSMPGSSYKGKSVNPSWGCPEIAFPTINTPDGYYRYNERTYFCNNNKWEVYNSFANEWLRSGDFPCYDKEGYLLLSPEQYYRGTVYDPEWGGYEPWSLRGYYRFRDVTYYKKSETGTDDWYIYDGGWKKSSYPVANYNSYYVGKNFLPEWKGSEILFYETPYEGYYLYNKEVYYNGDPGWFVFKGEWRVTGFPRNDKEGHIILANDYYKGKAFDPEWDGYEYPMTAGYYRYQGVTYYGLEDRSWYRYDHGWRSTGCPVGNFSAYYQGNDFQLEWDGEPFDNVCYDRLKAGYYRLDGVTYYLVKTLPSSRISGRMYRYSDRWALYYSQSPFTDSEGCEVDLNDYYMGNAYRPEWGGSSYPTRDGYYRQNGNTYYVKADSNSWYIYQGGTWTRSGSGPDGDVNDFYEGSTVKSIPGIEKCPLDYFSPPSSDNGYNSWDRDSSRWDSDWDSSDYDSWDFDDTDWDSDW